MSQEAQNLDSNRLFNTYVSRSLVPLFTVISPGKKKVKIAKVFLLPYATLHTSALALHKLTVYSVLDRMKFDSALICIPGIGLGLHFCFEGVYVQLVPYGGRQISRGPGHHTVNKQKTTL